MGELTSIPVRTAPVGGVRVVGLGASAGGLEPLEQFLSSVPAESGLAYLVVQHMDPHHKTLLVELLQRVTPMPVSEATDAQPVYANAVYVIPPDAEMTVSAGALRLARPAEPRGQRLPIDVLFSSLARELGERAIGVVLSGMGSDGTAGLRAIKTQGGLTAAQRPETAQFDSMPRNAIAAGCVDLVDAPADLPARLLGVIGHQVAPGDAPAGADVEPPPALETILALLRAHMRHDLTLYKSNTLVRRIARRIAVHGLNSMDAYVDFLRANAHELDLLFKEMLIGVTAFFRDPPVWQDLQERVLPTLAKQHPADAGALGAWVVGCSTGEEAYSLVIAFIEVIDSLPAASHRELQIFATDLNPDAIAACGTWCCSPSRMRSWTRRLPGSTSCLAATC